MKLINMNNQPNQHPAQDDQNTTLSWPSDIPMPDDEPQALQGQPQVNLEPEPNPGQEPRAPNPNWEFLRRALDRNRPLTNQELHQEMINQQVAQYWQEIDRALENHPNPGRDPELAQWPRDQPGANPAPPHDDLIDSEPDNQAAPSEPPIMEAAPSNPETDSWLSDNEEPLLLERAPPLRQNPIPPLREPLSPEPSHTLPHIRDPGMSANPMPDPENIKNPRPLFFDQEEPENNARAIIGSLDSSLVSYNPEEDHEFRYPAKPKTFVRVLAAEFDANQERTSDIHIILGQDFLNNAYLENEVPSSVLDRAESHWKLVLPPSEHAALLGMDLKTYRRDINVPRLLAALSGTADANGLDPRMSLQTATPWSILGILRDNFWVTPPRANLSADAASLPLDGDICIALHRNRKNPEKWHIHITVTNINGSVSAFKNGPTFAKGAGILRHFWETLVAMEIVTSYDVRLLRDVTVKLRRPGATRTKSLIAYIFKGIHRAYEYPIAVIPQDQIETPLLPENVDVFSLFIDHITHWGRDFGEHITDYAAQFYAQSQQVANSGAAKSLAQRKFDTATRNAHDSTIDDEDIRRYIQLCPPLLLYPESERKDVFEYISHQTPERPGFLFDIPIERYSELVIHERTAGNVRRLQQNEAVVVGHSHWNVTDTHTALMLVPHSMGLQTPDQTHFDVVTVEFPCHLRVQNVDRTPRHPGILPLPHRSYWKPRIIQDAILEFKEDCNAETDQMPHFRATGNLSGRIRHSVRVGRTPQTNDWDPFDDEPDDLTIVHPRMKAPEFGLQRHDPGYEHRLQLRHNYLGPQTTFQPLDQIPAFERKRRFDALWNGRLLGGNPNNQLTPVQTQEKKMEISQIQKPQTYKEMRNFVTQMEIDPETDKKAQTQIHTTVTNQMTQLGDLDIATWITCHVQLTGKFPNEATYNTYERNIKTIKNIMPPKPAQIVIEDFCDHFLVHGNQTIAQLLEDIKKPSLNDLRMSYIKYYISMIVESEYWATLKKWFCQSLLSDWTDPEHELDEKKALLITGPSNLGKTHFVENFFRPFKYVPLNLAAGHTYQDKEVYDPDVHIWTVMDLNDTSKPQLLLLQNVISKSCSLESKYQTSSRKNKPRPTIVCHATKPGTTEDEVWEYFRTCLGNDHHLLVQFKKRFIHLHIKEETKAIRLNGQTFCTSPLLNITEFPSKLFGNDGKWTVIGSLWQDAINHHQATKKIEKEMAAATPLLWENPWDPILQCVTRNFQLRPPAPLPELEDKKMELVLEALILGSCLSREIINHTYSSGMNPTMYPEISFLRRFYKNRLDETKFGIMDRFQALISLKLSKHCDQLGINARRELLVALSKMANRAEKRITSAQATISPEEICPGWDGKSTTCPVIRLYATMLFPDEDPQTSIPKTATIINDTRQLVASDTCNPTTEESIQALRAWTDGIRRTIINCPFTGRKKITKLNPAHKPKNLFKLRYTEPDLEPQTPVMEPQPLVLDQPEEPIIANTNEPQLNHPLATDEDERINAILVEHSGSEDQNPQPENMSIESFTDTPLN